MVDFHSHCLPALDDGARDLTESKAMLSESARQGIDTVVATPHFYASHETVDEFLAHRAQAVERLGDGLPPGMRLLLGAEVLLQQGVSKLDLHALCIEGTDCLLLELPFMPPSDWVFEELETIALDRRMDIILAHADRYMRWYSREQIASIVELPGLTVQLNAESLLDRRTFRSLRRWLPTCERLVFGSDMHHGDRRPPNLQPAYRRMRWSRCGRQWMTLAASTEWRLLDGE